STWDYGPLGVEMKNNIKNLWWQDIVTSRRNVVGMDAAILMHPEVWAASGHISQFHDLMIDNKLTKKRYRLDHLLEKQPDSVIHMIVDKLKIKLDNMEVHDISVMYSKIIKFISESRESIDLNGIGILDYYNLKKPLEGDWTVPRQFNLMLKTSLGATADSEDITYLRPETAQGIFVNFNNVVATARQKLPFGIAQLGKAFRNEITTGNFLFRTREFEQM
ncbi:glycine--tRNA ligase, partial [Candidatus Neomarinimicrobiota bacterium]